MDDYNTRKSRDISIYIQLNSLINLSSTFKRIVVENIKFVWGLHYVWVRARILVLVHGP